MPVAMPVEQGGEPSVEAPEGQRTILTPFLTKTYQLVDNPAVDEVISWNEDGSTFIVWRPAEFARDILPKYFKHNNFTSFVRQLNTYGFRKIVPDRWEFANECFRRGEKRLLCNIHRRKVSTAAAPQSPPVPQPIPVAALASNAVASPASSGDLSSNSSRAAAAGCSGSCGGLELREENERLRKENARLSHELDQIRSLCDTIYGLVSKYASGRHHEGGVDCGEVEAPPPLELMLLRPSAAEEEEEEEEEKLDGDRSPRLFGFAIRLKRPRDKEGEEAIKAKSGDEIGSAG